MTGIQSVDPERFNHGTRARYVAGKCRCEPCTLANRTYATERARAKRAGLANHLIDAAPVRAHLERLAQAGVGLRAVAAASDIGRSALVEIRSGRKTKVRRLTAQAVLEVDAGAIADHAFVSSREVHAAFREMRRAGLTKGEISQRLGNEVPALQYKGPRVLAATALKVKRLLAEVRFERSRIGQRVSLAQCPDCGLSHLEAFRRRELATYTPEEIADLPHSWPCLYSGQTGAEILRGDLEAIGRTL